MSASNVFRDNARAYWARGLSVVPGEPGTKRPAAPIKGWSGYCDNLPNEGTQTDWLDSFGDRNIGLLTNAEIMLGFRLGAIDVDRDEFVRLFQTVLGQPVSGKRGKKGATFFVRLPVEDKVKKTVVKDYEGKAVADILVGHSHTVIPPSIHPDTGEEYRWIGKPLLDCQWDELSVVGQRQLRILSVIAGSEFTTPLLTGEGTHDPGTRLVAQLVKLCSDEEITAIICALLPENYDGNSLKELPGWIASAREKGFDQGSEDDAEKTLSAKIVRIAIEAGAELFHDGENAFASVPCGNGILTYPVGSSGFEQWLRFQTYRSMERPVSRGTLSDAIATLEADALYRGNRHVVQIRVGGDEAEVEIDLGQPDGRVVRVTALGWEIPLKGERRFYRASGFEPLPEPERDGELSQLQFLLGLNDVAFRLFVGFLINALRPTGPYMALLVEGEQGSGKSFLCHVAKMLIDPNHASKLRLPDNERDLMIHAKQYRLLVYDNASGMRADMSDAFCALATGGGLSVRRLYTNDELQVFSYSRPFIINGISGYAKRPDLLERAIPLRLEPMSVEGRKTEGEILADFERVRPAILGVLYDAVSCALKDYPTAATPPGFRMADAARWIAVAEPALGFPPGAILEAIAAAQDDLLMERINDETLVIAIRDMLASPYQKGVFEGHIGELLKRLNGENDRTLPNTPQQLSMQLKRLRPAMVKVGLHVEFIGKDKRGQRVKIWSSLEPEPEPYKRPSLDGSR